MRAEKSSDWLVEVWRTPFSSITDQSKFCSLPPSKKTHTFLCTRVALRLNTAAVLPISVLCCNWQGAWKRRSQESISQRSYWTRLRAVRRGAVVGRVRTCLLFRFQFAKFLSHGVPRRGRCRIPPSLPITRPITIIFQNPTQQVARSERLSAIVTPPRRFRRTGSPSKPGLRNSTPVWMRSWPESKQRSQRATPQRGLQRRCLPPSPASR